MRSASVRTVLLVSLTALLPHSGALAYSNDGVAQKMQGGPHRKINELAFGRFLASRVPPELLAVLSRYDLNTQVLIAGQRVTKPTDFSRAEGPGLGTVRWWVVEGGYSADEPEIYNSFRHFYDPLSLSGVPYLTDHVETLMAGLCFPGQATVGLVRPEATVKGTAAHPVPKVDAVHWALSGAGGEGEPNPYCWQAGLNQMRVAFLSRGPDKAAATAHAWRALGETMHLLADMTCVPHVRNDSHPGRAFGEYLPGSNTWVAHAAGVNHDKNLGLLRNDPYELLTTETVVGQAAKSPLGTGLRQSLASCRTPEQVFDRVARYTNAHFFSADTISGSFQGKAYHNLNGQRDYPQPKLEACAYDKATGYLSQVVDGRKLRLLHSSWLKPGGWAEVNNGVKLAIPCVQDQASVLVPLAVAANARLAELYVPRVRVVLDSYDAAKATVTGRVIQDASSPYPPNLLYSSGPDQFYDVYVDGSPRWRSAYEQVRRSPGLKSDVVTVTAGRLTLKVGPNDLRGKKKIQVVVGIVGLPVRSNELVLGAPPPVVVTPPKPAATPRPTTPTAPKAAPVWKLVDSRALSQPRANEGINFDNKVTASLTGSQSSYGWSYAGASGRFEGAATWEAPPPTLLPGSEVRSTVRASLTAINNANEYASEVAVYFNEFFCDRGWNISGSAGAQGPATTAGGRPRSGTVSSPPMVMKLTVPSATPGSYLMLQFHATHAGNAFAQYLYQLVNP